VARLDSKRSRRLAQAGVELAAKADCEPQRFVREFRGSTEGLSVGQQLTVDVFAGVAAVDVSGISKGRGFSGVIKRWKFSGQRASHGVKKVHRHLGSTGCNTSPARTFKNKKMPGHFGHERCTMRNLKVVRVDAENHVLLVRGAVPGPNGGYVVIRQTNKL
jgi:large subunit ribosomal protein L3